MKFRKATNNDIDTIMKIINQAKQYFKNQNIDQWQDGYPNEEVIKQDIINGESYVLDDNGVVGTCMISKNIEHTYNKIDGKWLNDDKYIVVHRIAVDENVKGKSLASKLLQGAIDLYPEYNSIKMDTHFDNLSMQRFLTKNGFEYCGVIYLDNGDKRKAYQKIIDRL